MNGEAGGGYCYPDDEDDSEFTPDVGRLSASDLAMLALVTRYFPNREIWVEFSDEDEG